MAIHHFRGTATFARFFGGTVITVTRTTMLAATSICWTTKIRTWFC